MLTMVPTRLTMSDALAAATHDLISRADLSERVRGFVLGRVGTPPRVLADVGPSLGSLLTVHCYQATTSANLGVGISGAIAMEMLLAAADLLDDVQDEELEPSDPADTGQLLEVFGALLLLSHRALFRLTLDGVPEVRVLRAIALLDELALRAGRGQDLDLQLATTRAVTLEKSLAAIWTKAASLMRCAAQLGATLASDDVGLLDKWGDFGWHLGVVAQIMNDIHAVLPNGSGKSDIRMRKKTLPVAFFLCQPGPWPERVRVAREYLAAADGIQCSDQEVKLALWETGAIHRSWLVAAIERTRALAILEFLGQFYPRAAELKGLFS